MKYKPFLVVTLLRTSSALSSSVAASSVDMSSASCRSKDTDFVLELLVLFDLFDSLPSTVLEQHARNQ